MASTMKRNNDSPAARGPARKRGPGGRADKDGDISMDTRPRNNNNRVGKSNARGGASRSHQPNRRYNTNRLQDEIDMQDASSQSTKSNARPTHSNSNRRTQYTKIRVSGLKKSKASSNEDRGVGSLVSFLENKVSSGRQKAMNAGRFTGSGPAKVNLTNYKVEGDDVLIFSVPTDVGDAMVRMDGWSFAGANISIKKVDHRSRSPPPEQKGNADKIRTAFTKLLERRYSPEQKLLDLSALGLDPELKEIGVFDVSSETSAKVFPALMAHCSRLFKDPAEKREKIESILLQSNELASLDRISTLAHTFPDLKNLDLSNNKFATLDALRPWKNRLQSLEHLILTNNPIEAVPDYHVEIIKWFPVLRFLNGIIVRSDAEVALAAASKKVGLPVAPRFIQGDEQIMNSFVSMFFPGFDADRNALVNAYYDKDSQFSFNVNTHAMRDPSLTDILTKQEWESYIRRSRNLKAINHLPARQARLFVGPDQIRDAFATIPPTKHASEPEKVHIECQTLPVVPDGTGQYPQGVVGLLITVHGEYEELDATTGQATKRRSYDRAITLGPGLTSTGLRVINDMLTIRAYGGFTALQPDQIFQEREVLVVEFCKHTGMTPEYSRMCLIQSNWDPTTAVSNFEAAKATLPAEAFVVATT